MPIKKVLPATFITAIGPFQGHVDLKFSPHAVIAQAALDEVNLIGDGNGFVGVSGFFTRNASGTDKPHTLPERSAVFTHIAVSGITFVISTSDNVTLDGVGMVFLAD
jgi:hypothetical protein